MANELIPTRTVRRPDGRDVRTVMADLCVLGAGISGVSAALEAAKLGRKVVIVDSAPAIGGQSVGSIIGTLIGLYTHGPDAYQITHGIADDLIRDLTAEGALVRMHRSTVTFQYDEVRLGRLDGAADRRIWRADAARCGSHRCEVREPSGEIRRVRHALRFRAHPGERLCRILPATLRCATRPASKCASPTHRCMAHLNFLIEGYDLEAVEDLQITEVRERLAAKGHEYGLVRHDGWLMHFPGKNFMLANINHFETPLDPVGASQMVFEGRRQADNILEFLQTEYPRIFKNARVRTYGNPGIRQTRWIQSIRQLTLDDIRTNARPPDAAARCAWWVELHNTAEIVHWEQFRDGHVYYIPLSCMIPKGADNIVAAGRCVDGDSHALSAIRVMGPCIAMGTAAAHALDMAGTGAGAEHRPRSISRNDCGTIWIAWIEP